MDKHIIYHLSKDPVFRKVIETTEAKQLTVERDLYEALIRAIVFQQLSTKAATTIYNRFVAQFPGGYPHPEDLLAMPLQDLRAVGLSRQKGTYVQNIARFFLEEQLMDKDWTTFNDEELLQYLTQIKGVGVWTVQMIQMFDLRRPDIFPTGDLGIRNAMIRLYGLEESGKALIERMEELAENWRPYRSYACFYLWPWVHQ